MNLLQKIRAVWKSNPWLENRIPSSFLVYNFNPFNRVPRATFSVKNQSVVARTNKGVAVEKAVVEFSIKEMNFQNALNAAIKIIETFDGVPLDLMSEKQEAILNIQSSGAGLEDGLWTATIVFNAHIFHC